MHALPVSDISGTEEALKPYLETLCCANDSLKLTEKFRHPQLTILNYVKYIKKNQR